MPFAISVHSIRLLRVVFDTISANFSLLCKMLNKEQCASSMAMRPLCRLNPSKLMMFLCLSRVMMAASRLIWWRTASKCLELFKGNGPVVIATGID